MTIFASDDDVMIKTKKEFREFFTITDLGELKQVVGLEVSKDPQEEYIKISQKQYIINKKILKRFGMEDSNSLMGAEAIQEWSTSNFLFLNNK